MSRTGPAPHMLRRTRIALGVPLRAASIAAAGVLARGPVRP